MIATCTICGTTAALSYGCDGEWRDEKRRVWNIEELDIAANGTYAIGPVICEACRDEKTRAVAAKIADRLETLRARAQGVPE